MTKIFGIKEIPNAKRSSDRDYTHALIAMVDYDAALSRVNVLLKSDASNYNYHVRCAECVEGENYARNECNFPVTAKSISESKEIIQKYPSLKAYQEGLRDLRIARTQEDKAKHEGSFVLLQWSQSEANAAKGVSSRRATYKNFKVVPTIRIK